jgi:hypothetical protein
MQRSRARSRALQHLIDPRRRPGSSFSGDSRVIRLSLHAAALMTGGSPPARAEVGLRGDDVASSLEQAVVRVRELSETAGVKAWS